MLAILRASAIVTQSTAELSHLPQLGNDHGTGDNELNVP